MSKRKQALYIRKSREGEAGAEETLHNQRESLIRLAEQKGYHNPDIYEEIESSIDWNRPELSKLIAGIEAGKYDRLLITHIDRLGRDVGLLDNIKKVCIEYGVTIETPDSIINFETDEQELLYGFSSVLSDFEYKRIRHRLQKGKLDTVELRNRWIASTPPIGYYYDKTDKILKPDEQDSKIYRKMVDLALQGYSYPQIADSLTKAGHKTRLGNKFTAGRVQKILKNRVYLGEAVFHSSRLKKTAHATGCHEPLITPEEFTKIQELAKSRRNADKISRYGIKTAVDNLLICSVCGKGMTIQKTKKTSVKRGEWYFWQIRKCIHWIDDDTKCYNAGCKAEYIEEAVAHELKSYRAKLIQKAKELLQEDTAGLEHNLTKQLDSLTADLKKQQTKADKLLDLYLDGDLDKERYNKRKADADTVIQSLKDDISILKQKISSLDVSAHADKLQEVIDLIDRYEEMDIEEQNATLKLLVSEIIYTKTAETNNQPMIQINYRQI